MSGSRCLSRVSFGLLGFVDDYLKVTKRTSTGVAGRGKLFVQFAVAVSRELRVMQLETPALSGIVAVPFFKTVLIPLGYGFSSFGALVIVGASNAVNLTDGLDGLAIVPVMIAAMTFILIAYLVGNVKFADYLQLHYVAGTGELAVFLPRMSAAGLGFLWYNAPPAMVFMGDTGSLALGGALGAVAIAVKHEIVLAIVGGLFVMEAVSVIVQVASFKLTGKRVFRMAPIHHHFEQLGWKEPTIVIRFWIISVVLALVGLSTLKLRYRTDRLRSFANMRRAVFGLGALGLSSVERCRRAARASWPGTTAQARDGRGGAGWRAGRADCAMAWDGLTALVLSPGVPLTHPRPHPVVERARAAGVAIIGDIELFAREIRRVRAGRAPVIAITGTNGKSTTTALIGHILQRRGFAARDRRQYRQAGPRSREAQRPHDLCAGSLVLPDRLAPGLVPDVSVLSNIAPDHIDRHGSFEAYAAVKARAARTDDAHGPYQ